MWLKEGNTLSNVARLGYSYVLTQDIDMSGCTWTSAIADAAGDGNCTGGAGCFSGIFDGAGFQITNFTLTATSSSDSLWIGFFGNVVGGTVQDLTVNGSVSITNTGGSGSIYSGVVVGYTRGASTLSNLSSVGTITASGRDSTFVGGVVGYCSSSGSMTNLTGAVGVSLTGLTGSNYVYAGGACAYVFGTVTGVSTSGSVSATGPDGVFVGGVSGYVSGSVIDTSSSADVSGSGGAASQVYAGGITGQYYNPAGTMTASATGSVTVSGAEFASYAGGLIGKQEVAVTNSFATGNVIANVNGVNYSGGLLGYQDEPVTNSFASGNVSVTVTGAPSYSSYYVGGLIGYGDAALSQAYALGDVYMSANDGSRSVGGLVGFASGAINQAYSIGTLTGPTPFGSGTIEAGGTTASNQALTDVFCTYTLDLDCSNATLLADRGTVATLPELRTITTFSVAGWSITDGYSVGSTWGICPQSNSGYPFLTALHTSNPCIEFDPASLPPSWYQSMVRDSQESVCPEGWNPSWDLWPHGGTGGWVCNREIHFDIRTNRWSVRVVAN